MTERIEGHGGELALAALRALGVREMFTLSGGHVFPLYDAAHTGRLPALRRAARAVGGLRRRGGGQAAAPPRPGRAHRRPRRHQRHLRADQRLLQRLAGGGARRPGARSSAGARAACRRWTTCRWSPRSPSTPRRSSATDDIPRAVRRRADRRAHPAPRPGLPGPAAGGGLLRRRRRRCPAATGVAPIEPDPERGGEGRRAARRRASAGHHRRLRRVRRGRRRRAARGRRGAAGAGLHQRHGPRRAAAGAPARLRQGPPGRAAPAPTWSWSSAPRWTSGSASATSATPRWCTSSTRPASGPTHVQPAVGPAGDLRLILSALADHAGDRADHADWIAELRVAEDAGEGPRRRGDGRRDRPDPPGPDLRRTAPGARPGRDHHRRRRRLRLVRRASTWSRRSPAPGSTPARTAASAPAWATRWAPGSPTRTGRSAC